MEDNQMYDETVQLTAETERTNEVKRCKVNVLGYVGFGLGLAGITFCWYPLLGFIQNLGALIVSCMAMKCEPKKYARIGLITSIIGLVVSIAVIVLIIVAVNNDPDVFRDIFEDWD